MIFLQFQSSGLGVPLENISILSIYSRIVIFSLYTMNTNVKCCKLSPSLESHVWVSPTTNQTHHFDTNIPGIPEIQVPLGQELKINIHKIVLGFNSFRIWMHLRVRSFLRSLISESLYFPVSFTNSLMTHNSFFYSLVLANSISFHYLIHSSSFRVFPTFPTFEILFQV